MEGTTAADLSKRVEKRTEQGKADALKQRLERLLREAAQVEVELSRADESIQGIPHYSVIEGRAHELGKQLSREVQRQQMNELAALHAPTAKCPACGTRCELQPDRRHVKTVDGQTDLQELRGHCPSCRRDFFPSARNFGL